MRLSMSKPVRCARSNKLGGFQYSGTSNRWVKPNGAVSAPAQIMVRRNAAYPTNSAIQIRRKTLAHRTHT